MIREPLFVGFLLLTGGMVGLATIQPEDDLQALIFSGLAGLGFACPLILLIAAVQLATPHHLIATATAATTCSRAVAAAVFTAIYSTAYEERVKKYLPANVAQAALKAGLPRGSVEAFVKALSSKDTGALSNIPGVSPAIIAAGVSASKQAYADGLRVVYIIAAPFGILACFFLGDLRKVLNYGVDAPVENLRSKRNKGQNV
jgi:hypothetical protein